MERVLLTARFVAESVTAIEVRRRIPSVIIGREARVTAVNMVADEAEV